jgi:hypothetical protein
MKECIKALFCHEFEIPACIFLIATCWLWGPGLLVFVLLFEAADWIDRGTGHRVVDESKGGVA